VVVGDSLVQELDMVGWNLWIAFNYVISFCFVLVFVLPRSAFLLSEFIHLVPLSHSDGSKDSPKATSELDYASFVDIKIKPFSECVAVY